MTTVQRDAQQLVITTGSALSPMTLTLNNATGRTHIARRLLLWNRTPREFGLHDIRGVTVASYRDRASGATVYRTVLQLAGGDALVARLPTPKRNPPSGRCGSFSV
jgi:hypothetical protein